MGAVVKKNNYVPKQNGSTWPSFFCSFPTISLQSLSLTLFTFPEDSPALSQPFHLLHLVTNTKPMHFYPYQVKSSVNGEQYHELTVTLCSSSIN